MNVPQVKVHLAVILENGFADVMPDGLWALHGVKKEAQKPCHITGIIPQDSSAGYILRVSVGSRIVFASPTWALFANPQADFEIPPNMKVQVDLLHAKDGTLCSPGGSRFCFRYTTELDAV